MATQPDTSPPPRIPLSRERVLRTAIELADADGLESLSMRKLGRALGVEAMSLYNHVANKEDLLDGLADIIVGEIELPSSGEDWRSAMRRRAISARRVLTRHPWANGLLESRVNPSPTRLRYPDAVLGCLRDAGFSIEMAIHAFFALDSYIYGFVIQEKNLPSGTPDELAGIGEMMLRTVPASEYPHLNEILADHVLKKGFDYEVEFEFGLDLLLDGLEQARDVG
jgi:AcrR family transcriptional regulator